jgi:hypothetical protein
MTKLAEQPKRSADHAREALSEGWRELSARASGALTRFGRRRARQRLDMQANCRSVAGPSWRPTCSRTTTR